MPQNIDSYFKTEKNKIELVEPFIYCVALEYATNQWKYVTNHIATVTWNGHDWEPYPMVVPSIKTTSGGEVQTTTVTLSNISGFFTSYLRANVGLAGKRGYIYKLSKNYLGTPYAQRSIAWKFMIVTSGLDEETRTVTFNLSLGVDVYGIEGPLESYDLDKFPALPHGPPRVGMGVI